MFPQNVLNFRRIPDALAARYIILALGEHRDGLFQRENVISEDQTCAKTGLRTSQSVAFLASADAYLKLPAHSEVVAAENRMLLLYYM